MIVLPRLPLGSRILCATWRSCLGLRWRSCPGFYSPVGAMRSSSIGWVLGRGGGGNLVSPFNVIPWIWVKSILDTWFSVRLITCMYMYRNNIFMFISNTNCATCFVCVCRTLTVSRCVVRMFPQKQPAITTYICWDSSKISQKKWNGRVKKFIGLK